jgi:hypothetical protein
MMNFSMNISLIICEAGLPSPRLAVGRMTRILIPARIEIYIFATTSIPALEPTQHPIQWVPVTAQEQSESERKSDHSSIIFISY